MTTECYERIMEIRKNYGTKGVYFMENIISAAKTDVFRVRINPEIKQELESVYAKNGLTLTDAINVFFQQSLNAGGFPFAVTEDNAEIIKAKALSRLTKQLQEAQDEDVYKRQRPGRGSRQQQNTDCGRHSRYIPYRCRRGRHSCR